MASYFSGITTKASFGGVVDGLFSAAYTFYFGRMGLLGLEKIAVVFGRGVDAGLKACRFDTSKTDSWAAYLAGFVPERFTKLVTPDLNYNTIVSKTVKKVNAAGKPIDDQGKEVTDLTKQATEKHDGYQFSHSYLLASGLALTFISSFMLAGKTILWRETNPLLNVVLTPLSGFKLVTGESWAARLINMGVGAAKSRIG